MQPDVAQREADLFEQMENQFQLGVGERFAGDAAVKHGDADDAVAVGHRHGHLRAEHFKFLLRVGIGAGFVAVAAQNPAEPDDLPADAGIEREFKMFEQAGRKADGGRGAQPARVFRRYGISASGAHGRFRKMAARLTPRISRRNDRNCFSIASAFSE